MAGLSFYQWDDEPAKNLGSGTRRYFGWQTGLRFNNGKPKPVLSTMPAPFVIDQAKGSRSGLLWGQVRVGRAGGGDDPGQGARRGGFRDLATLNTAADGTWSRRITLTSRCAVPVPVDAAAERADPAPFPRFSGVGRSRKDRASPYKASLAF